MIAEPGLRPETAADDAPEAVEPRYAPQPARVPALQAQLGITGERRQAGDYGPTSHLSEDLLLRGYGLRLGEDG